MTDFDSTRIALSNSRDSLRVATWPENYRASIHNRADKGKCFFFIPISFSISFLFLCSFFINLFFIVLICWLKLDY
jgi:hypothetical protein